MLVQRRQCCQQVKQPRCSVPARLSPDGCCSRRNVQHCEGVSGDARLRPTTLYCRPATVDADKRQKEKKKTALGQTNPLEQKLRLKCFNLYSNKNGMQTHTLIKKKKKRMKWKRGKLMRLYSVTRNYCCCCCCC